MIRVKVLKVVGDSMKPTYLHGDYALALRFWGQRIRQGQVVAVHHPDYGGLIKRVAAVEADGLRLHGDNPKSTPSASFGLVPTSALIGRVFWRIPAPAALADPQ